MNIRLVRDVAWRTATKVVVALNSFGLKEDDRVCAFQAVRAIIEDGIKLFEDRRRREQARLARPEEPLPEPSEVIPSEVHHE